MPNPPSPDQRPWPHRGYAWYVVFALMVAYAFSIVDRTAISLLVQPIEADLHISDSMMGLLQGVAFSLFYGLFGLPLGLLADHTNRRRLITAGISAWSAATMACGLATGFPGLFLARLGVGVGEATLSPVGASMIADYFPPKERSKAYGLFAVGTSIGTGAAFLLGGAAIGLAQHLQLIRPEWFAALAVWKLVFLIIGAPGLLVAILFALTVREPLRRDRTGAAGKVSLAPLWSLLSSEGFVYTTLIAGAVLNTIAIYALVFWFPTLLSRNHGVSSVHAAALLGLFGTPAGVISCLGSGWIAAWLEKRGRADACVLVALGGVFWFSLAGIAAALAPTLIDAIAGYCLLGLATNCCAVSTLTALNRITPNELRGQISSILTLSIGLIALSVGPWATPFLSDHVFGGHKGIGAGMATVLVISGVLSLMMFALARPGYRRLVLQSDLNQSV